MKSNIIRMLCVGGKIIVDVQDELANTGNHRISSVIKPGAKVACVTDHKINFERQLFLVDLVVLFHLDCCQLQPNTILVSFKYCAMPKRTHDGVELGTGSKHKKLKTHRDTGRLVSDQYIQPNTNIREAGTIAINKDAQREKMRAKTESRKLKKKQEETLAGHSSGQRKHKQKKNRKLPEDRGGEISRWKVSDAVGGQMLDLDPIFSLNEEYAYYLCAQTPSRY